MLRAARRSKVQPSQKDRRKQAPKRQPGEGYSVTDRCAMMVILGLSWGDTISSLRDIALSRRIGSLS